MTYSQLWALVKGKRCN